MVITGGTSGIGKATLEHLSKDDSWNFLLLARNQEKAEKAIEPFNDRAKIVSLDLNDLNSVSKGADEVLKSCNSIDVLLNNAGGLVQTRQVTQDGYEMTFQMNHLGHFLLTKKLIDVLIKSESRVINVSSAAHQMGRLNFNDLMWEKRKYSGFRVYGDAKLCNIYFTRELHRRYHERGLSAFSLHPGVVRTNFGLNNGGLLNLGIKLFQPFMISPEKGASTQIFLSTKKNIEKYSGRYFVKKNPESPSKLAEDPDKAQQLWEVSEKLIENYV